MSRSSSTTAVTSVSRPLPSEADPNNPNSVHSLLLARQRQRLSMLRAAEQEASNTPTRTFNNDNPPAELPGMPTGFSSGVSRTSGGTSGGGGGGSSSLERRFEPLAPPGNMLFRSSMMMSTGAPSGREIGVRTAGLAMSPDGRTLWAACEEGIFEIKMNLKGRLFLPSIQIR